MPGIRTMPNDSTLKTFIVAGGLCLVCSIVVAAAAVGLKPTQEANKLLDKRRNVLQVVGAYDPGVDVEEAFRTIEPRLVKIDTGEYVHDQDAANFDMRAASKDPKRSSAISAAEDIAKIKRKPNLAQVYLVNKEGGGGVKYYILPVNGYGLWSTLYGYVALESDAKTVKGIIFYQHAETPGLGGEVSNPAWRGQWEGKQVYDENGDIAMQVLKGAVNPNSPNAKYQVDGLAGATLTSRGVSNLVQYWLGENGFKPYLDNVRSKG